jgi:hypothetical protein
VQGREQARAGDRERAVEEVGSQQREEERMDERREHRAADRELEGGKTAGAELPVEPGRAAHMHRPRLHPTLEPARALCVDSPVLGRKCHKPFIAPRLILFSNLADSPSDSIGV